MSSPKQSKEDNSASGDIQEFDFLTKSFSADIQLEVEGKPLYVSRSYLATISPVFRLMFESDFKEKNVDVLPLPGKKYEDVLTFLRCTSEVVSVTVNYANVYGVFPLAHEYQTQRLLEECTNCLRKELRQEPITIFGTNCRDAKTTLRILKYCEICVLAENYDLKELLEICVEKFTKISAKWYMNVPMFQKISTKLRNRIFSGRLDATEVELRIQEKRTLNRIQEKRSVPSGAVFSFGCTSSVVSVIKDADATESEEDTTDEEDIQEFEFLTNSPWTDIQLEVEGRPLYVTRSFLATISPVFRQMFESDFKEKRIVDVLPLPGKKYEDVETFLRCTHQGTLVKVEDANVSRVLPLAVEYQVQRLLEKCKQCLQNQLFSLPTERFDSNCRDENTNTMILECCAVCFLADKYDLEDLLELCVEKFTNVNANWYKNLPMFQNISTKLQNRIFCSRLIVVEKAVR